MTTKTTRYLVPADGPETEPIKTALALLAKLCGDFRTDAILLVPTKRNIEGKTLGRVLGSRVAGDLLKNKPVPLPGGWNMTLKTERTFQDQWTSSIIMAVYATKKMLDQIDTAKSAPAVIVVPWIMEQVNEWRRTWNPRVVGEPTTTPEPLVENAVVEEALESLTHTVNLSTGLSHPDDRRAAVQLFHLLHENGELFDPGSIRAWVLRNGWDPEGADQLRGVAQSILDGKRIHLGPPHWKRNIIGIWRERAKGGEEAMQ